MLSLFKRYSISDLEALRKAHSINRKNFQIAVIEDKVFPCLDELRNHQYNITVFPDIARLSVLADFDIVISDIKGVGKHFGSSLEGAHMIEEIHKRFPNKYLIAYSGSTYNPTYNRYFKLCDDTKKKSVDVHEWVTTIDRALELINDPVFQWEKTRQILISQRFSLEQISSIEKAYAKSILKKNMSSLEKVVTKNQSYSDSPLSKIAIDSIAAFCSSFISNLITGAQ